MSLVTPTSFPEGVTLAPHQLTADPAAALHMTYAANTLILARIGLMPDAAQGAWAVLPPVDDLVSVEGLRLGDGVTADLSFSGEGPSAEITVDGAVLDTPWIPFEVLGAGHHQVDVHFW